MPSFRYEGWNASGEEADGTLDAADANAAVRQLGARGVRVQRIFPVAAIPRAPRPTTVGAPVALSAKAAGSPSPLRRSASDRERYFIFAMLADQLRAGIPPAKALDLLSGKTKNRALSLALREASVHTAGGGAASDAFARHPNLFSPFAVGMTRAGEHGGFLPDAAEAISEQAMAAHRFRRYFWVGGFFAAQAVVQIPFIGAIGQAMLDFYDRAEASGGQIDPSEIGSLFVQALAWPVAPASLGVLLLWIAIGKWLGRAGSLPLRHRLALRWPVVGKRALDESIASFSWALGRLSKVGLSPQRAWETAADAVPNVAVAERLKHAYRLMGERTGMADAAERSGVFEDEYTATIANGELVGNLPEALDRVARYSRRSFDTSDRYAKMRVGCWFVLATFVAASIGVGMFMWVMYREIPARILGE